MSRKKKHAPLPFKVEEHLNAFERYKEYQISGIVDGKPRTIVHLVPYDGQTNAEFIVRACNSHYELLEVLKEIKSWIDNWHPDFCQDDEWYKTANKYVSAIAKAESKQTN